ncbi:MAG TPA: FAD-dependent oxidoreductase [Acidimicrobiia bacterium]|nr:FAD-dependent oxidoreductase [Acidimicrobiia bacterium]
MTPPRVAILGGGMAGLATAWELSRGDWRKDFSSITVYQRGWRLGGKGASSRGEHGRIEEHGLHVLLGYYDATFELLREVYAELDRATTDPNCPLRSWRDAVEQAPDVGLTELHAGSWRHFVTRFSTNDRLPGEPGAASRPLRPLELAVRALRLLIDFHRDVGDRGEVYLSASPTPRAARSGLDLLMRTASYTTLGAALEVLQRAATATTPPRSSTVSRLGAMLEAWRSGIRRVVDADPTARRTWQLVDLVATNLVGMAADGILLGGDYRRIDHLDYRDWLAEHGASAETLDSPIVRGMYDLTFAYERGDRSRPRFSAGLGLELAQRMLFDFKGAIFWRMRAGMGETVFAPLYQALAHRGVAFEFFHRLDEVVVENRAVAALRFTQQAELAEGRTAYEPLIRVRGIPAWPARPLAAQLAADPGDDLETHGPNPGAGTRQLRAGEDFDVVVMAVPVGMVPYVARGLTEADSRWRQMVDNVGTVATRSAQLWLRSSEHQLGWDGPAGVTLSGFGDTFDTWASMSHLLSVEEWPPVDPPRSLAYLCGAMPDVGPGTASASVREAVTRFLDNDVAALWPRAVADGGFRWDELWDDKARVGPDRLRAQYLRANVDPSDRYVQSLPGSGRFRIAPGDTGFRRLVVAGDWTACGLDAGCVEAAVRSARLAADAVRQPARWREP